VIFKFRNDACFSQRSTKKNIETTPYVNAFSDTPDKGFGQFLKVHDLQRDILHYSTRLAL
jgi:hypothetical protein